MYSRGYERLEKEMDIIKLIRSQRNLKIYSKYSGFKDEIKFAIKNARKNIIDIDKFSDNDISSEDIEDKDEYAN